jgi:hypothetical protein
MQGRFKVGGAGEECGGVAKVWHTEKARIVSECLP